MQISVEIEKKKDDKFKFVGSFRKLIEQLKKENKAFWKKGKKAQRVAIAKDVLLLLGEEKINPRSTYLDVPYSAADFVNEANAKYFAECDVDLGDELDAGVLISQASCAVCGIGSLFVAAVRKNNKMTINDFLDVEHHGNTREDQADYLEKWFDNEQLDLIEEFFEHDGGYHKDKCPMLATNDKNQRLRMIMENIISNDGKFDPTKGRHKNKKGAEVPGNPVHSDYDYGD